MVYHFGFLHVRICRLCDTRHNHAQHDTRRETSATVLTRANAAISASIWIHGVRWRGGKDLGISAGDYKVGFGEINWILFQLNVWRYARTAMHNPEPQGTKTISTTTSTSASSKGPRLGEEEHGGDIAAEASLAASTSGDAEEGPDNGAMDARLALTTKDARLRFASLAILSFSCSA